MSFISNGIAVYSKSTEKSLSETLVLPSLSLVTPNQLSILISEHSGVYIFPN